MDSDRSGWNEMRADGVLVLGMHRSGTSLVAGSLHLLGLATCGPGDLMTGMPWNPSGHWESRSLSRFNDELLAETGRSWWYPPPPAPEYFEIAGRLVTSPEAAGRQFHRTYTSTPWVWKDPRLALLLPFWRRALGESVAAVLVHRNPLEVARSLELRNGFPVPFGVALWARYNRLLLEQCRRLPLLVVRYEGLVEDPDEWIGSAESFLGELGGVVGPDAAAESLAFVQPTLRHVRDDHSNQGAGLSGRGIEVGDEDLAREVEHLGSALTALEGVHASFVPPALESERPAVEAELSARWPEQPPAWNDPPWSVDAAAAPPPATSEGRQPR
jgi:hypothetical protein